MNHAEAMKMLEIRDSVIKTVRSGSNDTWDLLKARLEPLGPSVLAILAITLAVETVIAQQKADDLATPAEPATEWL